MRSCPQCDEPLERLRGRRSTTPPWFSPGCRRLWWDAELVDAARSEWDRTRRCYRVRVAESILLSVANERAASRSRRSQ